MKTCPDCKNDLVCHDQGECLRPTPTPETDEQLVFHDYGIAVDADFARNLERERNEARQAFAIATDQLVQVQSELRQARATCEELITDSNAVTLAATVVRLERERNEAREENARLREILQRTLAAGWDGPLPAYIREQAAQLLTP